MTEQEGTTAEEVLLYLIAQLVEHPDQVELEIEESDKNKPHGEGELGRHRTRDWQTRRALTQSARWQEQRRLRTASMLRLISATRAGCSIPGNLDYV